MATPAPPVRRLHPLAARPSRRPRRSGQPLSRELAHWREALRDAPAETPLPADRPGRPGAEHPGDAVDFDWGPRLGTRLKELAAARGATTFMALHAALACALSRWGAGTDVVVGTVTAGREDPALEPLVTTSPRPSRSAWTW
ncbi:condensation domain-containing protein [Streptomyces albus]|nr:condensation domain-containing protein [Streptomyces albus]